LIFSISLTKVESKILIVHAEDDFVIPIYQAEKVGFWFSIITT